MEENEVKEEVKSEVAEVKEAPKAEVKTEEKKKTSVGPGFLLAMFIVAIIVFLILFFTFGLK